jgi:hypothetical protein
MRRLSLLALLVGLVSAAPVEAQEQRVELRVSLGPDSFPMKARPAWVQVLNLLADKRWSEALEQLFPVRLDYRLEIWRARGGWIDEFQRATEWSTVVQKEPLQDQYRVTLLLLSGPQELRFPTQNELARYLNYTNQVDALPTGTGTFYYTVTLTITALSEKDIEALERFLAGQPAAPAVPERNSLMQRFRQLLLRAAGLPWDELEGKSPSFRVAP